MKGAKTGLVLGLAAVWMASDLLPTAAAEDVTFFLKGVITAKSDPENVVGSLIETGDVFTCVYVFDLNCADSNFIPTVGDYQHTNLPYGAWLALPHAHVSPLYLTNGSCFLVEISDNHGIPQSDNYLIRNDASTSSIPGVYSDPAAGAELRLDWQIDGLSLQAITSTALSAEPPDLAQFSQIPGLMLERYGTTNDFWVRGIVEHVAILPTPIRISRLLIDHTNLEFQISEATPHVTNTLQCSTNLLQESWQDVTNVLTDTSVSNLVLSATQAPARACYRVATSP